MILHLEADTVKKSFQEQIYTLSFHSVNHHTFYNIIPETVFVAPITKKYFKSVSSIS